MTIPKGDPEWPVTWEENRRAQFEAALAATPAQRLAWLEEAIRFAYEAGALPRDPDVRDDDWQIEPSGKE